MHRRKEANYIANPKSKGDASLKKRFVIDTSVLIYDVDSLYKFEDNEVIIPSVVYEEINLLKEEDSERGYYARQVAEVLDQLSSQSPLKKGVKLGNTLIKTSYDIHNTEIDKSLLMKKNDYKILSCAKNNDAILVTRDKMFRVIARDFVKVEDYHADKLNVKELYKGYRQVIVPEQQIEKLFRNRLENEYGLYPNEFIIMTSEVNPQHTAVGICKGERIVPCEFDRMNTKGLKLKVKPLNLEQKMFLYLLTDDDITCVTAVGASGKGKSLQAVDFSIANVTGGLYNQFLYTKSTIAVDSREELGFYKGSMEDKLKPHLQPLYSSVEFLYQEELYKGKQRMSVDAKVEEMIEQDILRLYPLANIRGMSIFDKVVMLDEGQNTTRHMMKSLVTRVNDSSKLIVTGDIEQIDDKNLNMYNNGLSHLIEEGKDEPFIAHISMSLDKKSKRGLLASFGSNKL